MREAVALDYRGRNRLCPAHDDETSSASSDAHDLEPRLEVLPEPPFNSFSISPCIDSGFVRELYLCRVSA